MSPEVSAISEGLLSFHHVGVATRDLEKKTATLAASGYRVEGPDFTDPILKVSVRFLPGPGPRLEILCQTTDGRVLDPWLKAGTKLYHLAYQTSELDRAVAELRNCARMVKSPVPATAFDGQRIGFLMLPNLLLIEVIEAASKNS